jgi:hypothetical protein
VRQIEQTQAGRLAYLGAAYEFTNGHTDEMFDWEKVAEAASLERSEALSAINYLTQKDLLKWETSQWLSITPWGVDEIEQLLANPERPSENLPAPASINVMQVREMYGPIQVQQRFARSPPSDRRVPGP